MKQVLINILVGLFWLTIGAGALFGIGWIFLGMFRNVVS